MARSQLRHTVRDEAGNVLQNALVNVYEVGTTTPVADMYAAASGGTAITTLTSNAQGEIIAYLDTPRRVDLNVTDNGASAYWPSQPLTLHDWDPFTETLEVLPSKVWLDDVYGSGADATAATDGQVLTADGGGGAAWESATSTTVVIAEVELASDAATVDFQSIPATYRHLVLRCSLRASTGGAVDSLGLRLNGATGTVYDYEFVRGNGTTASASSAFGSSMAVIGIIPAATATASKFAAVEIDLHDYADTGKHKVASSRSGAFSAESGSGAWVQTTSCLWRSTAAVDRVTLSPFSASAFLAGSIVTLYGVKGA